MSSTQIDPKRFAHDFDIDGFLQELKALQIPCPWGDLTKSEGMIDSEWGFHEASLIPHIPLGLVIGCGHFPQELTYNRIASAQRFGKIVYSDIINPNLVCRDYVKLNLEIPEQVHLYGYKVHAIMSSCVFTYDGHGVEFPNQDIEKRTAKALSDLLMPGGIVANDNLHRRTTNFERLLMEESGFKQIEYAHSKMLQKPF